MKKLPDWIRIAETVDGGWMVLSHGFQVGGNVDSSGAGDLVFPTRAEAVRYAESHAWPSRPLGVLRYHVTGAIERGEAQPIEEIRASAKGGVA